MIFQIFILNAYGRFSEPEKLDKIFF